MTDEKDSDILIHDIRQNVGVESEKYTDELLEQAYIDARCVGYPDHRNMERLEEFMSNIGVKIGG